MLCALRLTNIGCVQRLHLGSLVSLYRFVMRTSPHKHRVCAVLAPRFPLEFCTRVFMFCVLCLTTSGLCSAFRSAPCSSFYAYLSHVTLCVLRLTNISFVQFFPLGSFLSLHAYIGHVFSKQSNLFLHFLSTQFETL